MENNVYHINQRQERWPIDNKATLVIDINPDLYLDLTTPSEIKQEIVDNARPLEVYNSNEYQADSVVHPFFSIDMETGKIVGHEGRHRAAAVLKKGGKYFRVAVLLKPLSIADVPKIWYGQYTNKPFDFDKMVDMGLIVILNKNVQKRYQPPVVKENQESTSQRFYNRTEWRNSQGQKHRTDGPAVEYANGSKEWWQNGQLHRLNGPAVEYANGSKEWYQNDQLHRLDGPAFESADGREFWWLFGKRYPNEKSWEQARNKLFLIYKPPMVKENQESTPTKYSNRTEWHNSQGQRHRLDGPAVEYANGTKEWYQNDQRHRLDGPAIEWADGHKYWYQNDQLHRLNGPAIEYYNGTKVWFLNGQRHRIDGPAFESADGTKTWWLFGKHYPNEKSWEQARNKLFLIYKPPVVKENQKSTPRKFTNRTVWYDIQGRIHRTDGPAIMWANGDKQWYQHGQKHRLDGPAVELRDGSKSWYQHGQKHRLDGPAVEWANGTKEWWQNGQLHRTNGPAVELADGTTQWLQNDNLHRTDGPAVEWTDGSKDWYLNGQRHRLDGPAIEYADGTKEWYLFGKRYPDEKSWEQARNKMLYIVKPPIVKENRESSPFYHRDKTSWYNKQGQLHRLDGPAIEYNNGSNAWYRNDQLHRTDGPAVEWMNGNKSWLQNDQLHRIDGPAIERADGTKEWWLFNKQYSNEQAWEQARNKLIHIYKPPMVKENQESKPKKYKDRTEWLNSQGQIHRIGGPAIEWADGVKDWYQNDQLHRINAPAVIYPNGNLFWYLYGDLHRIDGPAIEFADGSKGWWLFGKRYPNEQAWEQARNKMLYVYKPPVVKENQESKPKKYVDRTEWVNSQGQRHRIGGPAIIWADGTKEWYQNGQRHRLAGPAVEYADGSKEWYQNGKLHRVDGPAVEWANGTKEWYQHGQRHRTNGPAVERPNGEKQWWQNNELHRLDGPAVKLANGDKEWYQNGQRHRIDGPAVEHLDGEKQWWQNGKRHRINGPAVIRSTGTKLWYLNGQLHRIDGPAVEFKSGDYEWFLFDKRYPNEKSWEQARNKMIYIVSPSKKKTNENIKTTINSKLLVNSLQHSNENKVLSLLSKLKKCEYIFLKSKYSKDRSCEEFKTYQQNMILRPLLLSLLAKPNTKKIQEIEKQINKWHTNAMEKTNETAGVGLIVKGVNTTKDVGPNEIKKQAKKFGNKVNKKGVPPISDPSGKFQKPIVENKNILQMREQIQNLINQTAQLESIGPTNFNLTEMVQNKYKDLCKQKNPKKLEESILILQKIVWYLQNNLFEKSLEKKWNQLTSQQKQNKLTSIFEQLKQAKLQTLKEYKQLKENKNLEQATIDHYNKLTKQYCLHVINDNKLSWAIFNNSLQQFLAIQSRIGTQNGR